MARSPMQAMLVAKVSFPDRLTTKYGRQIRPLDGMNGQAEFITMDKNLPDRIYDNLIRQLR